MTALEKMYEFIDRYYEPPDEETLIKQCAKVVAEETGLDTSDIDLARRYLTKELGNYIFTRASDSIIRNTMAKLRRVADLLREEE